MKLEIKIEPTSSMDFYSIYYRFKKKFNLFNAWKQLVRVWNLIKEHYDREDKKYQEAKKKAQ